MTQDSFLEKIAVSFPRRESRVIFAKSKCRVQSFPVNNVNRRTAPSTEFNISKKKVVNGLLKIERVTSELRIGRNKKK